MSTTRSRWNPPPGWPQPPAGWRPPPGWEPDPTWPPAPPDWSWWVPVRWSRGKRIALVLAVVAVGGIVAALLVADIIGGVRGCGSIDPGDPTNYSVVTILNDTRSPVSVGSCRGSYCNGNDTPVALLAGESVAEHAACGAGGSDMTSWRLSGPDGRTLGYIAVDTPRKQDGLVYPVSAASPDRVTPTRHR